MNGKRITEQETRERMLALSTTELLDNGLTVGLGAIRMETIIKTAGVSRASAYRIWPTRDDFLADCLLTTLRQVTLIAESPDDIAALLQLIDAHRPNFHTEQGRRDLVIAALRLSIDADIRRNLESTHGRLFRAVSASFTGLEDPELREKVRRELVAIERDFVTRRAEVYHNLARLLGYRQRPPWEEESGFLALSERAGMVMLGILSRAFADPSLLDKRTSLRLFGASQAAEWSQPEIALASVLLDHLEPDPDVEFSEQRIQESLALFKQIAAGLR